MPWWVNVRFVVEEVALDRFLSECFGFALSYVIIPPTLRTHFNLCTTLTKRTSGQSLETFKQSDILSDIGEHWIEKYFHIVRLRG
jgi:hypothetical protein